MKWAWDAFTSAAREGAWVTEENLKDGIGTSRISRRSVIKAGAIVGGTVWVAPVIDSFTNQAAAQSTPTCGPTCVSCFSSGTATACGGPTASCLCSDTVEGVCFCAADQYGVEGPGSTCTSSSQCAPGERCMVIAAYGCSAATCLPSCADDPPYSPTAPRPSQAA